MKKFISVLLSICMISGLALAVNAEKTIVRTEEMPAVTENFTIISKDMITGEVTSENVTYQSQGNQRSYDAHDSHPPYIPSHLKVAEWPGDDASTTTRGVVGADDRVRVSNTREYPYSAVCYLEATFPDGSTGGGTAWMVSDNIAITAGHCVYDDGEMASTVKVWPGKNGTAFWNNPYGSAEMIHVFASQWMDSEEDDRYDWAVIVLDDDVGNDTGWFGYSWGQSDVLTRTFTLTGYPGEYPCRQYTMSGNIVDQDTHYLVYSIDATDGQSGGPIYNSDYRVYGWHTRSSGMSANIGVRITEGIFNYIEAYCNHY